MTTEEREILKRADEIQRREVARREDERRQKEFTLIHEEDGYRIYRRNYGPGQWWLYWNDKVITTSQYRKGVFGVLYHIQEIKTLTKALA